MAEKRTILVCSCEDTMPLDADAIRRGCRGAEVMTAHHLCRAELERFRAAAATGEAIIVGCTQEAPLFSETAERRRRRRFANIRETAGWSTTRKAGPKMAALLAAAAEPLPDIPFVSFERRRRPDLWPRRAGDRGRQAAQGSSRRHGADHAPDGCAAARHRFSGGARAPSDRPRAISAPSRSWSTTTRAGAVVARRACASGRPATARCRAATSCSISPAARRCSPRPICATAICAPIPAIPPRCCARC